MFLKYNIWGFLWILFIFFASATPGDKLPPSPFFDFDKVVHLLIYGVLQLLLLGGLFLQKKYVYLRIYHLVICIIFSTVYGVMMEVLQETVFRNRSFDVFDVLANVAGVAGATIIWLFFIKNKIQQKFNQNNK